MATAAATTWCGWFRPGRRSPWELIASAGSWDQCWAITLSTIEERPCGETVVLREGTHPLDTAARRSSATGRARS